MMMNHQDGDDEFQHSLREADRMELVVSLLVSPSSKRERVLTPIATGKAN